MWHSYGCHLSFIGPDSMGRLLRTSFFLVFQNHGSLWTGTPSQFVPVGLLGNCLMLPGSGGEGGYCGSVKKTSKSYSLICMFHCKSEISKLALAIALLPSGLVTSG